MRAHLDLLASARSSVLIATPYFVPGAGGLTTLREARARGVRFSVLTNSLATTDEPLVHFGYARYRLGMLKLGVALHELIPMRERRQRRRPARTTTAPRSAGCTPSWSSSTSAGSRSAR